MKKIVIGTTGHIDHGKTSLIKALTGIDCDRLKEEKERGITIELGFAHYRFGDDLLMGIVDVPGHEKFVRHMVAGAWGIDMVLLVVAADEGVMPQTKEHIDICELLGLDRGIVAITKKDLVDEEMLELVKEDIKDFLKGRPFEGAQVIPVSSATGENIDVLRDAIISIANDVHEKSKDGIFRLPIDRVFTLKGLGTIVTGTCISGHISVGEEIEIYPLNKYTKIRNIQTYHEDAGEAMAGERVALNLQGIEKNDIERGIIIGRPDTLLLSNRIDATFKYLKLPYKPIKTDTVLRFHVATTQEESRLVILKKDIIEPGEELFVQLVFKKPVVVLPEDRFIIRSSYAIQTIGGGKILDIMPQRHKRKAQPLDSYYSILTEGSISDKTEYHILKGGYGGIPSKTLSILLGMNEAGINNTLENLKQKGKIKSVGKTLIHMDWFNGYKNMLKACVEDFHKKNPLKVGLSKEELRTKLPKVEPVIFQAALDQFIHQGLIETDKDKVRLKGISQTNDKDISAIREAFLIKLLEYGLMPPGLKELASELKQQEKHIKDIAERLIYEGKVVKIKGDMYFHMDIIKNIKQQVTDFLKKNKEMSPSDFKTIFDISRKYTIPILEYLDEIKLTIRSENKRILRS
ncbi:MAG TPA: selenocysteine-specific translation elongation factor [Syntrophorhabdaceae bacterium]|nr:selenocysteine-specific translation elongation factor [Syntrophorhabdaceae bacterium]HOB69353.1 selenocysteine-specific translation elongation factor [Syntrophorhabdaceae bacterium]HOF57995.1 selenocysteine-specific translation elongation factor [Syntrophorhabdaceae bacterium]HOG40214.1 selenocysteine-specific translation elongation factor [Syntrophorhabdaceae bacterium]HOS05484.1 selenocysteine-specific translation elongation factor [Syntrophorhabdaceae bacterium]